MTTYDPALCERLVAEAREAAGLLEKPLPDCTCTGWYSNPEGEHELNCVRGRHDAAVFKATRRAQFSAVADQLEAARVEVARFYTLAVEQGERAALAEAERDKLEKERDALRSEVEKMRPVVAAAIRYCGPDGEDASELETAVDAYRSKP